MLVNKVDGKRNAASMVKSSEFYIELAKFVQAYSMVVTNPNAFLKEVKEQAINEKTDFLTWQQLVKIMTSCDFGFKTRPTETELLIYYNYALEMGSLGGSAKKIASVEDVANAQKHYYNFIDDSVDRAEEEFMRSQQIAMSRDREADQVEKNLSSIKTKNTVSIIFMFLGAVFFSFGLISVFFDNVIARNIGRVLPITNTNIVGGIIFMIAGICIFAGFNGWFVRTKYAYLRLRDASKTIFIRSDNSYNDTMVMKNKLDNLKEDLKIAQAELNDPSKAKDVIFNIEKLAETNKYYKQFAGEEIKFKKPEKGAKVSEQLLSEIKLSKEERENIRTAQKEAIVLSADDREKLKSAVIADNIKEAKRAETNESEAVFSEFEGSLDSSETINADEIKKLKEIEKEEQAGRER